MTLFLILHKVSGAAALDVAQRCDDMGTQTDPGPWWIIPTSGHRAYPYKTWPLDDIGAQLAIQLMPLPDSWPDHYGRYLEPRRIEQPREPTSRGRSAPQSTPDDLDY